LRTQDAIERTLTSAVDELNDLVAVGEDESCDVIILERAAEPR
jgi:hypothetical protein